MWIVCSDGSFDCAIPLSKEGPVCDVQWSPTGKEFVVVAGTMPSHATVSPIFPRVV